MKYFIEMTELFWLKVLVHTVHNGREGLVVRVVLPLLWEFMIRLIHILKYQEAEISGKNRDRCNIQGLPQ